MPYYKVSAPEGDMAVKASSPKKALQAAANFDLSVFKDTEEFSPEEIIEFLTSKPTVITKQEFFKLRQQAKENSPSSIPSRLTTSTFYLT